MSIFRLLAFILYFMQRVHTGCYSTTTTTTTTTNNNNNNNNNNKDDYDNCKGLEELGIGGRAKIIHSTELLKSAWILSWVLGIWVDLLSLI